MEIFKALMSSSVYGWTSARIYVLNIDVVFADDKQVRAQWKAYYDKLCVGNPKEKDLKRNETEKCKLLEEISKSLGYKNKIIWETIQSKVKTGFSHGMKSIWMSNVVQIVWNSFKTWLLKCSI